MNTPTVLTIISILVTVIVYGLCVRWRGSAPRALSKLLHPGWEKYFTDPSLLSDDLKRKLARPASADILNGSVRSPLTEIKTMLGLELTFGIVLAFLSLVLRSEIPEYGQREVTLPFLALGLVMLAVGSILGSRLDRPTKLERTISLLAYWIGADLLQITCLFNGVVFLSLAVVGNMSLVQGFGILVIFISSIAGILLIFIGIFRQVLLGWFGGAPGPSATPADNRKAE